MSTAKDKRNQVDVYGCVVGSRKRFERFLEESYESDEFFSEFTSSQDAGFYDHDSLEWGTSTELKSLYDLIKGRFRWASFAPEAAKKETGERKFNGIILLYGEAVLNAPQSYEAEDLSVTYIGRSKTQEIEGAEKIDGNWRQCCYCMDIWEEDPTKQDAKCPDCNKMTRLQFVE